MIAINITSNSIHVVSGKSQGDRLLIRGFNSAPLPCAVFNDGISDVTALANAASGLLDGKGFEDKDVSVVFSSVYVGANDYQMPYDKKPAIMSNTVLGQVASTISFDENSVDYTINDIYKNESGAQFCKVTVYSAKKSLVEDAKRMITALKRKPAAFTVAQSCIYSLLMPLYDSEQNAMIAAKIDGEKIDVHLFNESSSILTRDYSLNARNIDDPNLLASEVSMQISKMIQFQMIKHPKDAVDKVYLFGDLASPALAEYVGQSLDRGVEMLPLPDYVSAPDGFDIGKYAYAVGILSQRRTK